MIYHLEKLNARRPGGILVEVEVNRQLMGIRIHPHLVKLTEEQKILEEKVRKLLRGEIPFIEDKFLPLLKEGSDNSNIQENYIVREKIEEIKKHLLALCGSSFVFREDEFDDLAAANRLINSVRRSLGLSALCFSSKQEAINWLNSSIEPYKILISHVEFIAERLKKYNVTSLSPLNKSQLNEIVKEAGSNSGEVEGIVELLLTSSDFMDLVNKVLAQYKVDKLIHLSDEQLRDLAREYNGERLKKIVLQAIYPNITPVYVHNPIEPLATLVEEIFDAFEAGDIAQGALLGIMIEKCIFAAVRQGIVINERLGVLVRRAVTALALLKRGKDPTLYLQYIEELRRKEISERGMFAFWGGDIAGQILSYLLGYLLCATGDSQHKPR